MVVDQLVPEVGNLKIFVEQFPMFVAGPNGVSKLRDLIIHFAVSGRLVGQLDKSFALADFLVNQEEKARLAKGKIIKTKKKMPEVTAEDIPYKLPPNWIWTRIGVVTSYGSAGKADYSDVSADTWVLELEDIEKETSKLLSRVSAKDRIFKSSKNRFKKGDVLYGKLRPYLDKVLVADTNGVCTTEVIPLYGFSCINPCYLRWVMKSPYFKEYADNSTHGMGMPRMGTEKALAAPFPFPPLEEQQRIVARVDELMALCDKLEAQQQQQANIVLRANTAAISTLLQSVNDEDSQSESTDLNSFETNWQRIALHFNALYGCSLPMPPGEGRQKKHLVGLENVKALRQAITTLAVEGKLSFHSDTDIDLASIKLSCTELRNSYIQNKWMRKQKTVVLDGSKSNDRYPKHWTIALFDDVAVVIGGLTKGRSLKDRAVKSYPYLRVANVQRGFFRLDVMKEILIPVEEYDKYKLQEGDLLITEGGDWDKVGRTAIWKGQVRECLHQNHVFKARVSSALLMDRWVEIVFNSGVGRTYFANASKQTTNLASINMTQLRGFPLPIPPADEQSRIVSKVDELMALCDKIELQLSQAYSDAEKLIESTVKALVA